MHCSYISCKHLFSLLAIFSPTRIVLSFGKEVNLDMLSSTEEEYQKKQQNDSHLKLLF